MAFCYKIEISAKKNVPYLFFSYCSLQEETKSAGGVTETEN